MSEALAAVYPATMLQTCIVHLFRHSLDFANWKERKPLAAALRPIYAPVQERVVPASGLSQTALGRFKGTSSSGHRPTPTLWVVFVR